jgi:hypothetical protein
MTLTRILTLCAAPMILASCVASGPSDGCAGWRPVRMSAATVDYLAQNDPETLKALIAHQETGKARGCW